MDKALVFGTKDCRFESCQGQYHCQRYTRVFHASCFVKRYAVLVNTNAFKSGCPTSPYCIGTGNPARDYLGSCAVWRETKVKLSGSCR